MTTLRDLLAATLHEAEDGPACPRAAKHLETYEPLADAVLDALQASGRLLPKGFAVTEKSPAYDVIGGRLMRWEVITADGPRTDWGGQLDAPQAVNAAPEERHG